jgi:O-antigen/teichoic acid export membrane protein
MKRLKQHQFLILADQVVCSGTGFLLTILAARHLEAPAFGWYSAYVLAAYLAVSVLGAWTIAVFQVAREKTPQYVSFVFWVQVVLAALVLMVLTGLNHFAHWCDSAAPFLFGAGFVLHDFGRKFLIALGKTLQALVLDGSTALLLLLCFGLFQRSGSRDVHTMLGLFAMVYFISIVLTLYFSQARYLRVRDIRVFAGQHLREGKWLFFTALCQWWAGNLLVVASGVYLGPTALGALRLGQSLFGVLNVLLQTFEHYVLPRTALHFSNSLSDGLHYLKNTNRKLGLAFLPVLTAAFVFAKPLMALAGGAAYTPYAFVLRGLCMLYVFIFLAQPVRFAIRALKLHRHFFYGYVLNLGFALTTSAWLLSHLGLYGVLIGLMAAQMLLLLYWALILQQQQNINVWKSFISY